MNYFSDKDPETIGKQIASFLDLAIERIQPQWIVPVERKGTALLRAYVDSSSREKSVNNIWEHVLSSETILSQNELVLGDGTVLLVDDAMQSGKRVKDILKFLVEKRNITRERIKLAVFGVHESSASIPVDCHWFGQLSDSKYRETRELLVNFFQRQGSLLLDTEHIEVLVEIDCGRLEFFDALCRAGIGVEYLSSGDRINLTIHDPLILDEEDLLSQLPAKTTIKDSVRKIRVVERAQNKYALIPIFYPSTPSNVSADDLSLLEPCLYKQAADPETNFHLVGIYAALYLIQTALMCLHDLIARGKVKVQIPRQGDHEDSLSHLLALFPKLDIEGLHLVVEHFVESGRSFKGRRRFLHKPIRIDATEGTQYARRLAQYQWLALREVDRIGEDYPDDGLGVSLHELMSLVECKYEKQIETALLSTALDRAIDEADLVPDISKMLFSDGEMRFVRTFRIDGEIILSDVRRVAAIWRESSPPPKTNG